MSEASSPVFRFLPPGFLAAYDQDRFLRRQFQRGAHHRQNLALRTAPNPGYVIALLLTSPLFVFGLNKYNKIPDDISIREGFLMIAFLAALMILVTGNFGVND